MANLNWRVTNWTYFHFRYAHSSNAPAGHTSNVRKCAAAVLFRVLHFRHRGRAAVGRHPATAVLPQPAAECILRRVSFHANPRVIKSVTQYTLIKNRAMTGHQSNGRQFIWVIWFMSVAISGTTIGASGSDWYVNGMTVLCPRKDCWSIMSLVEEEPIV